MATAFPIFLAIDLTTDAHGARGDAGVFLARDGGLWTVAGAAAVAIGLVVVAQGRAGEVSGTIAGRITVWDALVTAQLALSLALLVVSGLFVRGVAAGARRAARVLPMTALRNG